MTLVLIGRLVVASKRPERLVEEGLEVAGVAAKLSTLRGLPLLGGILTRELLLNQTGGRWQALS